MIKTTFLLLSVLLLHESQAPQPEPASELPALIVRQLLSCTREKDAPCVKEQEQKLLKKPGIQRRRALRLILNERNSAAAVSALNVALESREQLDIKTVVRAMPKLDPGTRGRLDDRLAGHKEPEFIAALVSLLKARRPRVRETAIRLLVRTGAQVDQHFIEATSDPFFSVRIAACEALRGSSSDQALSSLALLLKDDPHSGVRVVAARILGDSNNRDAAPALIKGLDDRSFTVRSQCHASLKKLSGRDLPPTADEWTNWLRTPAGK